MSQENFILVLICIGLAMLYVFLHSLFDTFYWKNHKLKNFPFTHHGRHFWFSRSCATCGFIFKRIQDKIFVLAEKRGKGAADFQGMWCVPCGYLDFDETLEECIIRESKEECGFEMSKDKLTLLKVNSNPNQNRQNVSIHFGYVADSNEDFNEAFAIGGEKDEVNGVKWVQVGEVSDNGIINDKLEIPCKEWAFNHGNRVIEHMHQIFQK